MAAILAQMRGDAIGAGRIGEFGGAHRIGKRPAARIADGRDMVNVDAQPQPGHAREPGLTAGIAASSGGSASAL